MGDETRLAQHVVGLDGVVLIAWEHKAIPSIGNAITGNGGTVPQQWPGDRFDILWEFSKTNTGWSFTASGQGLLAGDFDLAS